VRLVISASATATLDRFQPGTGAAWLGWPRPRNAILHRRSVPRNV